MCYRYLQRRFDLEIIHYCRIWMVDWEEVGYCIYFWFGRKSLHYEVATAVERKVETAGIYAADIFGERCEER